MSDTEQLESFPSSSLQGTTSLETPLPARRKRLPGGRRKAHAPDMEEELTDWIDSHRSCRITVTRSNIQRKALQLYSGDGDFSASQGWVENFLMRNGFSLRCRTC